MKKIYLLISFMFLLLSQSVKAQQLFTDNFNYTATQALTLNGWIQNGNVNTSPVLVTQGGLTFNGYVLSQVGNAAALTTTGQDVYKDANANISTGNIYAAFILNITSAQVGGDYFFSFLPTVPNAGYLGRVYAKLTSVGYYKLGVGKGGEPAIYGIDSFEIGSTSLVVLKYQFINGPTNDSVTIYNFTDNFPMLEPTNNLAATIGAGGLTGDATSLGRVALRQGTVNVAPALVIDGIRLASSWADLNSPTLPDPSTGFIFNATGLTTANLSWIKPGNYSNAGENQVVFIKPLSPINNGINNVNQLRIVADSNFSGMGSTFQNDGQAKCVYKGDSNKVNVSGLAPGTTYFAAIYNVNVLDSLYSNGAFTSGITNSAGPSFVTGLIFTAGTATSATVNWIKPSSYRNTDFTTYLFVKEATVINPGVPKKNPANLTANANFTSSASAYEFDSSARCVFKGDTNLVTITNLKPATLYYLLSYVVSDADSLFSNPANANGSTKLATPAGVTQPAFTGLTSTIARINWTKPSGYLNALYSTLVFVKQVDPIAVGIPVRNPLRYTANPNFGIGTSYQNDAAARCVFKGDTNFVNIAGLTSNKNYYVLILIVRDADSTYSPETLVNGMTLGPPPFYTIAQINQTNLTTGVIDSNNVRAALRGIVYGVNLRTSPGIQFVLRDQTGGILVLNTTKDYFYKVTEGDSVEVQGVVTQNRGWSTLSTLDTIIYLGSGGMIKQPVTGTNLNEVSENDLVRINNLNFVTPIKFWPTNAAITKAYRTGTTDTFNIRTYANTSVAGSAAPTAEFSIIGLGAQSSLSATAPFAFNGYQVIPSRVEDIIYVHDTLGAFDLIVPSNNAVINLKGDSTLSFSVTFTSAVPLNGVQPPTYHFLLDYPSGNFVTPLSDILLNGGASDTSTKMLFKVIAANLPMLHYGDSILLKYTIKAITGTFGRYASQSRIITFKRGAFTSVKQVKAEQGVILITPNPVLNAFVIESEVAPNSVQIFDITGKSVFTSGPSDSYITEHLPRGLYFVKMQFGDQSVVKKIVMGY